MILVPQGWDHSADSKEHTVVVTSGGARLLRPKSCALLFWFAKQRFDSLRIPLGGRLQLRVANRGSVATHINGVHHRQGAPDSKSEAKEKTDDRWPIESHDKWSLSRQACTVQ